MEISIQAHHHFQFHACNRAWELGGGVRSMQNCHQTEKLMGNSDSATRFYPEIIHQIEIPCAISFFMVSNMGNILHIHGRKKRTMIFAEIEEFFKFLGFTVCGECFAPICAQSNRRSVRSGLSQVAESEFPIHFSF